VTVGRLPSLLLALSVLGSPVLAGADATEPNRVTPSVDPDFATGQAAFQAKDWTTAITAFSSAALRDTRNADIENYLGYAYRQTGQLELAFKHYERALQLDPRHRGAHEYIGEAYLIVNDLAKAEEHLAALKKICFLPCAEYRDLRKAIAEHRQRAGN
jgi:tetratricopeptide (TPR) repeat protein